MHSNWISEQQKKVERKKEVNNYIFRYQWKEEKNNNPKENQENEFEMN